VAVLPASGGTATRDPIVPLLGGPGESGIDAAGVFAAQFASLRRERDLLLVDQRGTGRSAALGCDLHVGGDTATSLAHLFPSAAAAQCARRTRPRVDLDRYTYLRFAHDLERVRRALGYGKLNLFSASYGTRAAQVFLRTYPKSVRTAYLGSVVPLDVATPLTMAKSAQTGLERLFDACEADNSCRDAFPALRKEHRAIETRLEAGQVRVVVPDGARRVLLPRGRVAEFLRSRLYRPASAADVPWLIHRAHAGDWSPIVDGILTGARGMASALDVGLFLTLTCNDDVAFIRERDVSAATRDTFLGDYRVREQQAACRHWTSDGWAANRTPVRSSVPTMFVSGDSDAASPLWFTARVAPGFSDRVEIIARGQGHTEWNPCVGRLYDLFVSSGTTRNIDGTGCPAVPRPPFRTH
jgi:pimeloyl-ACP methyl ester carboxylesterase